MGQGSPNQHICHFKAQTGNMVTNDSILACLFIGTLKGIAIELLMKLPEGSIHSWSELRSFLTRLFEDGSEIAMPALLALKQEKKGPIKVFIERF